MPLTYIAKVELGLPPWLKRTRDAARGRALVKYEPPPAVDLTDAEELNGWTPETLAAYHAESHARAMAIVAASMSGGAFLLRLTALSYPHGPRP